MEVKYVAPTSLDQAPQNTIWQHLLEDGTYDFYIQISQDPNMPKWEKIGFILAKVFQDLAANDKFIAALMELYNKNESGFSKLIDIIKLL